MLLEGNYKGITTSISITYSYLSPSTLSITTSNSITYSDLSPSNSFSLSPSLSVPEDVVRIDIGLSTRRHPNVRLVDAQRFLGLGFRV